MTRRLTTLAERLNALSIRERGLVFAACVTLVYMAWQTLWMGPLNARTHAVEQRLIEARRQQSAIDQVEVAAAANPQVAATVRNRALSERLVALDGELKSAAQGYVSPQRMTDLLREILAAQHGLTLVSLANLPVESLSQAPAAAGAIPAANDRGPFLHPVEMVVEGDYASLVAYLRALEALPYRIHWQQLDLTAGEYPVNRVRIVIGALSLSREWITV
jgi:MSHA biogenesis protein MshJ